MMTETNAIEVNAEIAKIRIAVARIEEKLTSMDTRLEAQSRDMLREFDVRDRQSRQSVDLALSRVDMDRTDAQRQVTGLRTDLEPRIKALEARPDLSERLASVAADIVDLRADLKEVKAEVHALQIGWSRLLGAASVAGIFGGGVAAAIAKGVGG